MGSRRKWKDAWSKEYGEMDEDRLVETILKYMAVGNVRFHAQQRALQLAGGLVCGNRENVNGQH